MTEVILEKDFVDCIAYVFNFCDALCLLCGILKNKIKLFACSAHSSIFGDEQQLYNIS